jgi:hypothetical protein
MAESGVMRLFRHAGRSVVLLALAFILNVCVYLHGHHTAHIARTNYQHHLPPHGTHRGSGRRGARLSASDDTHAIVHADGKVVPKAKSGEAVAVAAILTPNLIFRTDTAEPLLIRAGVMAANAAARAPGAPRGPPTA